MPLLEVPSLKQVEELLNKQAPFDDKTDDLKNPITFIRVGINLSSKQYVFIFWQLFNLNLIIHS